MAIISGFRGTLDFYVWKGIPCVRTWPRKAIYPPTQEELNTRIAFTWASQNWQFLSPEVQDAYRAMAAGTTLSGRDLFVKFYISKTDTSFEDG